MLLRRFRRNPNTYLFLRISIVLFVVWSFIDLLKVKHAQTSAPKLEETYDTHRSTRLFIASTHWNNEKVLRSHWNNAIIEIVEHFGPENVYVSIYESGSWDDTKGALQDLDARLTDLKVPKTIVLDPTTHQDEIEKSPADSGWIDTPRGKKELRRIPYLASLRNKSLAPLFSMFTESPTRKFDKILFLNDVFFSLPQVLTLLSTNSGHYATACALDFSHPPTYYDTFALRDSNGAIPMMQTWPYFRSSASRSAVISHKDAVPVRSCWNGMVVMDVEPFYDKLSGLRFRATSDTLSQEYHVEASECCLIHIDNPYSPSRGVWLNPRVRVGYNKEAWLAVRDDSTWLTSLEILSGLWKSRILRWSPTDWFTRRDMARRVRLYKAKTGQVEMGIDCLINEMQVLVGNGWAHV